MCWCVHNGHDGQPARCCGIGDCFVCGLAFAGVLIGGVVVCECCVCDVYARSPQVIGSHVIFGCDQASGVIQEHVYIDNVDGKAPKEPNCSGAKKYVMPIANGCNNYDWGSMYMAWKGFCQAPKDRPGTVRVDLLRTCGGIASVVRVRACV